MRQSYAFLFFTPTSDFQDFTRLAGERMIKSRGNELEDSVSALYNGRIISYFSHKSKKDEKKTVMPQKV
jgi:hypothetical protein